MGKFYDAKGKVIDEDVFDAGTEEWLKSTDQLVYGVPALDPDRKKRVDVWLEPRYLETIEHAKKIYGGTAAAAVKAALELLREKMGLDSIVHRIPESDEDAD